LHLCPHAQIQFVSLLITSTGFASSELARRGTLRRPLSFLFPYAGDDVLCNLYPY